MKKRVKPDLPDLVLLDKKLARARFILDNFIPDLIFKVDSTIEFMQKEFGV